MENNFEREHWVLIPGYSCYYISNFGRVLSTATSKPKILKTFLNITGYPRIKIEGKNHFIHLMVAAAFIPEYKKYHQTRKPGDEPMQIDHIDRNKLNNNVLNLQLITRTENLAKREFHGK